MKTSEAMRNIMNVLLGVEKKSPSMKSLTRIAHSLDQSVDIRPWKERGDLYLTFKFADGSEMAVHWKEK